MIHIVLFRPEKPQNTGNIMRTCVAIHACLHIIGPLSFSIDSKDLKRVGMDYIDDLKMFYYPTIDDFYKKYYGKELPAFAPEEDIHVHGLMTVDGGKKLYREAFVSTVKTAIKKMIGRA